MPGAGRYLPIEGINEILKLAVREVDPATHSTAEGEGPRMVATAAAHMRTLKTLRGHPLIHMIDARVAHDVFYACATILREHKGFLALDSINVGMPTISAMHKPASWNKLDKFKKFLNWLSVEATRSEPDVDTTEEDLLEIMMNTFVVLRCFDIIDTDLVSKIVKYLPSANAKYLRSKYAARRAYRVCLVEKDFWPLHDALVEKYGFERDKDAKEAKIGNYVALQSAAYLLGEGSFGSVYKVRAVSTAINSMAVKLVQAISSKDVVDSIRDYEITRALHFAMPEYFIKNYCTVLNGRDNVHGLLIATAMEFASYNSLGDALKTLKLPNTANVGFIDTSKLVEIALEIAIEMWRAVIPAVHAMHEIGYAHCDIKANNIMVFNNALKLGDLNLCMDMHEDFIGHFNKVSEYNGVAKADINKDVLRQIDLFTHGDKKNKSTYANYGCVYAPEFYAGVIRADDSLVSPKIIDTWGIGSLWYDIYGRVLNKWSEPYDKKDYGNLMICALDRTKSMNISEPYVPSLSKYPKFEKFEKAIQKCLAKNGRSYSDLWDIVEKSPKKDIIHTYLQETNPKRTGRFIDDHIREEYNNAKNYILKAYVYDGKDVSDLPTYESVNARVFSYERTDLDDRMALSN